MRIYLYRRVLLCGLAGVVCGVFATVRAERPHESDPATLSVQQLRDAIQETQSALDQLPKRLIRESGGTLGHRTLQGRIKKDQPPWLQVDLGKIENFDLIVLIPMVLIDEDRNQSDVWFPDRYQITTFDDENEGPGQVLFDSVDRPGANQPNRAPVLIPCPGTSARSIRMTALEPTRDPTGKDPMFALAELMVFDGHKNLTLGKEVKASIPTHIPPLYQPAYATDGYMPFSQPRTSEVTENNLGMVWKDKPRIPARFTLDLGREFPIDEVRLYPVHIGHPRGGRVTIDRA